MLLHYTEIFLILDSIVSLTILLTPLVFLIALLMSWNSYVVIGFLAITSAVSLSVFAFLYKKKQIKIQSKETTILLMPAVLLLSYFLLLYWLGGGVT